MPVALQSHSSTGWELQVLKPSGSLRKLLGEKQVSGEGDALVRGRRGVSAVLTECSLLGDSEIVARSSRQGAPGQLHIGALLVFPFFLYILIHWADH